MSILERSLDRYAAHGANRRVARLLQAEPDMADLSLPPPPAFVAHTCPDCGGEVMRLQGTGIGTPVLVEPEELVAYGVRGPGAGQMRVVRVAHRPRCPGRSA